MPRYFFHVSDSKDLPDLEGTELPDDATAKAEAIVTAGTMLSEGGYKLWDGQEWIMRVKNETGGQVLRTALFSQDWQLGVSGTAGAISAQSNTLKGARRSSPS